MFADHLTITKAVLLRSIFAGRIETWEDKTESNWSHSIDRRSSQAMTRSLETGDCDSFVNQFQMYLPKNCQEYMKLAL